MTRNLTRSPDVLHPVRLLDWESRQDGLVTVLRPKFGTGRLGRWLSGRLSRPYCRVKLDDYGSLVWKHCDGQRAVPEIADALRARSRESASDLRSRLSVFLRRLERDGMIGWAEESTSEHQ